MQPFLWYNVIVKKQNPQEHYTAYQLKLPVEIEKIIEISDPVYSYSEVMDHIDLNKYMIKIFTFPYMRDIALALLLYYIKMDTLQFQANILIKHLKHMLAVMASFTMNCANQKKKQ